MFIAYSLSLNALMLVPNYIASSCRDEGGPGSLALVAVVGVAVRYLGVV